MSHLGPGNWAGDVAGKVIGSEGFGLDIGMRRSGLYMLCTTAAPVNREAIATAYAL